MSQSYSCCSGLGSPHSQKVPQPLGSTEKATGGPEDMPAVPVPVEKVPAAGRAWGCGRGVGERPGLGRRGADPPRVSAPGVNKSVPPRRVPAEPPAVAPRPQPAEAAPPELLRAAPLSTNPVAAGSLKLRFFILTSQASHRLSFPSQDGLTPRNLPSRGLSHLDWGRVRCQGPQDGELPRPPS